MSILLSFNFWLGLIIGGIGTAIAINNLSKKAKAAIQADLDAANAKIAGLTKKV